jgi:flagellar basal body rod protein FlgG
MVYGLWQSAGGLAAQDYRQTILAHNLAHADTPGFKPDRVAFVERLNASHARGSAATRHAVLDAMTGGVFESATYVDFSQGSLTPSANAFDVAIQGDGFLRVQTADGDRVTRDGRLVMQKDGTLLHAVSGGAVLDVQGRSISLDPNRSGQLNIDAAGRVRQGDAVIGQLALVDVADRQALEKVGKNLFSAGKALQTPGRGEIRQFFTEESVVEPVTELVDMMAASRAYQLNATMISLQDESLGRTVNELGRIA